MLRLASRSLIWNEAISRATVFLSVLSAATIALALLADATGFGPQTTTLALVLLPVVLFLGIAAHGRLVEINREEVELLLAMNRLRRAYLKIAPALEPYFSTGHHDDEQGLAASYLLAGRGGPRLWRWGQFLVNTPTIVATLDAALAAAIVVLVVRAAEAATVVAVVAGAVAFLVAWAALCLLQRRAQDPLRRTTPRFPHAARRSLNDLPVRLPRSSQWSAAARCGLGDHGSHVKPTPRTLLGVVVALSSGRPCVDFKVGSPGAGDDSSPSFCDSPNEPAGPGDAATHGG